jgi:hypothetical protein
LDLKPKFLTKENPESFQVPKMVNHSYSLVNNEKKYDEPTKPAAVKRPVTSIRPQTAAASSIESSASTKKGTNARETARNAKAVDKESAKDKVKRQRLSGQSGIGSDFKEWRSEEFMKQRQQYD